MGGVPDVFLLSRRSRALKASPKHSQSTLGLLARALGEGQQIDRKLHTKINTKSQITALWCAFRFTFFQHPKHPKYSKHSASTPPRCALKAIAVFLAGGALAGRLSISIGKIALSGGRSQFLYEIIFRFVGLPTTFWRGIQECFDHEQDMK